MLKEEAGRRAKLRVSARYATAKVNPFDVLDIQPVRERGWDTKKQISEKMRNLLERQGIDTDGMSYTNAGKLINEILKRWDKNQCSYKQAKLLAKYNLPTDVGFSQASEWITSIKASNWKLPESLQQHAPAVEVF